MDLYEKKALELETIQNARFIRCMDKKNFLNYNHEARILAHIKYYRHMSSTFKEPQN